MLGTCLLLGLLSLATYTDLRWGKIYNWTTYPGILLALVCSAAVSVWAVQTNTDLEELSPTWGLIPLGDSLVGFVACGIIMLVCYVSFPGGVGGGDIKLVAMIGAWLGLQAGLTSLLWTFVLGGCAALIMLVWRYGAWSLVRRSFQFLFYAWRAGPTAVLSEEERQPLKTSLYLAPSAALAVVIVTFQLVEKLMPK